MVKSKASGRGEVFVLVSGHELDNPGLAPWLKKLAEDSFLVVCVGGTKQISAKLAKGEDAFEFGYGLVKKAYSLEIRQAIRTVYEENQKFLQDRLAAAHVSAEVVMPVFNVGSYICPVSKDQIVRCVYPAFDRLVVVTSREFESQTKNMFTDLLRVEVKIFD